jgi:hypothetical protein
MSKARVASLLSLLVPGVGQIYNGDFWRGIFWLLLTACLWLGAGSMAAWVCNVISTSDAHISAHCLSVGDVFTWFGPIAFGHLPACYSAHRRGSLRDAESQRPAAQN